MSVFLTKKLIIHFGMHKTGTSSIQKTLYENRENIYFRDKGYYYPKCWPANHSRSLVNLLSGAGEFTRKNNIYLDLVEELKFHEFETLIISGEGLLGDLISDSNIENIYQLFQDVLGCNIELLVVGYVRNPVARLVSWFQQRIKGRGDFSYSYISEFIQYNIDNYYKITKYLDLFTERNVKTFKYEDANDYNGGVVGHFYHHILNFSWKELDSVIIFHSNTRASQIAIDICSYINESDPVMRNNIRVSTNRTFHDVRPIIANITGPSFSLDHSIQYDCLARSKQLLKFLAEKLYVKYSITEIESQIEQSNIPSHLPSYQNLKEI